MALKFIQHSQGRKIGLNSAIGTSFFAVGFLLHSLLAPLLVEAAENGGAAHADFSTLYWPAVNFLIFLTLATYLYQRFVPPLLKARAHEIGNALRQSAAALQEAQEELDMIRKRLAEIAQEKAELAQRFTLEAEKMTQAAIQDAKAKAERFHEDVQRQADTELKQAEEELKQEVVTLAVNAVKKRLSGAVSVDDDRRLRHEVLQPSLFH